MKSYNQLIGLVVAIIVAGMVIANCVFLMSEDDKNKEYNVEANLLVEQYRVTGEISESDVSACQFINGVEVLLTEDAPSLNIQSLYDISARFEGQRYLIRPLYPNEGPGGTSLDGELTGYIKFYYLSGDKRTGSFVLWYNGILILVATCFIIVLLYLKQVVMKPIITLKTLSQALAKGDYTTPIQMSKNRFVGELLWGLDMFRETIDSERQRTRVEGKEKALGALSLSHDIKTPLTAIMMYIQALQRDMHTDEEQKEEMLVRIYERAEEIQSLVAKLQTVSETIPNLLPVEEGEFYLDDMIQRVVEAYRWRMKWSRTEFEIVSHSNCLLKGDGDRAFEAMNNLLENAMKYGDGHYVGIEFAQEAGYQQITVVNSGNTLLPEESAYIFDSFWRGSNARGKPGSGLGLSIVRRSCVEMGGEAFVSCKREGDIIGVTLVFRMG
ncbi:MAG: HAMP domain-containing histidine kinase [Peptococcaceae bacterium]|nr:HAMP domain-containing histidine kinase [Peptococcaceae bacterium]